MQMVYSYWGLVLDDVSQLPQYLSCSAFWAEFVHACLEVALDNLAKSGCTQYTFAQFAKSWPQLAPTPAVGKTRVDSTYVQLVSVHQSSTMKLR